MPIDSTSLDSILSTICTEFPDAVVGEDSDGQIIINTGVYQVGDPSTPLSNKENINETAESAKTYVVVLSDGETYMEIEGCRILEVPPHGSDGYLRGDGHDEDELDQWINDNFLRGYLISELWLWKRWMDETNWIQFITKDSNNAH